MDDELDAEGGPSSLPFPDTAPFASPPVAVRCSFGCLIYRYRALWMVRWVFVCSQSFRPDLGVGRLSLRRAISARLFEGFPLQGRTMWMPLLKAGLEARDGVIEGALAPPAGVTPNFENPVTRRHRVVVASIICPIISGAFFTLRMYTRVHITRRLGWDDCMLPSEDVD